MAVVADLQAIGADGKPVKRSTRRPAARKPGAPRKPRAPKREMTLSEAVAKGTRRDVLVATRTRIAKSLEDDKTPATAVAALTKRLTETMDEIDAIDVKAKRGEEAGSSRDDVGDGEFDASTV